MITPRFASSPWSRSVVSNSLRPHGLWPIRLLRAWDFPGQSAGVDCHFLLQGIFQPRNRTRVSRIAGRGFTVWATREALSSIWIIFFYLKEILFCSKLNLRDPCLSLSFFFKFSEIQENKNHLWKKTPVDEICIWLVFTVPLAFGLQC